LNALHGRMRKLDGETRMVAAVGAFAGVVEEQRKTQQPEIFNLRVDVGEAAQ
jgi:hypothetical protein